MWFAYCNTCYLIFSTLKLEDRLQKYVQNIAVENLVNLFCNAMALWQIRSILRLCAIWYYFYELKKMWNTHGEVLFSVLVPPWAFYTFFKFYKWYQVAQSTTYLWKNIIWIYDVTLKNILEYARVVQIMALS